MHSFRNKVVWITGASSGFGEALAHAFAAEGAKLILSARRVDALERVSHLIGANARVLPLDLSATEQFTQTVDAAWALFGHIDIIVHNGGIAQRALALETDPEVERRIFEIDFFSYTELTRRLLPRFIERGSGHIVVVSGALGKIFLPQRTSYCAAKAALHGYFGSLRNEVAAHGIKITLLVPGAMQTELVSHALTGTGAPTGPATATTVGCPVDKAARQALRAIAKGKFEAYIGKRDKTAFMIWLNRLFPAFVTRLLLKQSTP